jgi:hypothetical protein
MSVVPPDNGSPVRLPALTLSADFVAELCGVQLCGWIRSSGRALIIHSLGVVIDPPKGRGSLITQDMKRALAAVEGRASQGGEDFGRLRQV